MELSSTITEKSTEEYKVHESRFVKGSFLSGPDRLIVVAQLNKLEKAVILQIPYSTVSVKYQDGVEPRLRLHRRVKEGQMMDAYMSGPYRKEEIVEAEFELPIGYKILGEPEKSEGLEQKTLGDK